MSGIQITYLVILAFCALGSGFFSGSETALIGIGRERVHQLSVQGGRRGIRVQQLVTEPDRLLSTLLVANNMVNILGTAVATTLFIELLGEQWGPWIATAVVTAVILIVGEITPKTLAARYPERFSLAVAPTIYRLSKILGPVARTFTAITRGLFRLLRIPASGGVSAVTEDDIRALSSLSLAEGEIEAVEHEILDALFTLQDRPVREVMTPRVDIVTLTVPIDIAAIRATVAETGHSRYPVTTGDLDHLLGVLYVKDLLQLPSDPSPDDIRSLVRTPRFVPESAPIMRVLHDLRAGRSAFAVVLDEHGGVDGLVTVKDLVSELVGELQDEYDPGAPSVVAITPREWLTDGRVPIEELSAAIGVDLPSGAYTTAGGLLMAVAGRIPEEGDVVVVENAEFKVIQMDRNRVDRIRVVVH